MLRAGLALFPSLPCQQRSSHIGPSSRGCRYRCLYRSFARSIRAFLLSFSILVFHIYLYYRPDPDTKPIVIVKSAPATLPAILPPIY